MNILSVMVEPNSKRRMCIKTAVQQITAALKEEDDENIFGGSGSCESDLSDEDGPTYVAPTFETGYSGTEVTIGSTYSNDYESESEEEDERFLNISPSAPDTSLSASDRILWTGKDGTFWNSSSSPEWRYRTHNVIRKDCTPLHHQKSILLRMLSKFFLVKILLRKYCYVQTCKVDGLLHKRRNSWLLLFYCFLQE